MIAAKVGAAIIAGAIAAVFVILAFLAQGAPGAPGAMLSTAPNPAVGTSYTATVEFQQYSVTTPDFFGWQNPSMVVSVSYTLANGALSTPIQNARLGANVLSSSGDLYTMGATVVFTIPATCSGTGCAGTVLDIAVTSYGIVPTGNMWASATGPTTTVVFSNVAHTSSTATSGNTTTGLSSGPLPAPPSSGFDFQLYGGLTVGVSALAFAFAAFRPELAIAGGLGLLVFAAEFVILAGV